VFKHDKGEIMLWMRDPEEIFDEILADPNTLNRMNFDVNIEVQLSKAQLHQLIPYRILRIKWSFTKKGSESTNHL